MAELKKVTILFLLDGEKILLAMKKRGFGMGRWNGVGGKLNLGETIEDAAQRECLEEIGVRPLGIEKVAILDFIFHSKNKEIIEGQSAHVYFTHKWEGEPSETEEMKPKWFNIKDIPYSEMWDDDIFWLPAVINGKKIHAEMKFSNDDKVIVFKAKAL